jgi:hypothetical protein
MKSAVFSYYSLFAFVLWFQLSGTSSAIDLTVEWDRNIETDLSGYRVHWGQFSKKYTTSVDVGQQTRHIIADAEEGRRYYIAVTAVDLWGNESAYSREVVAIAGEGPVLPSGLRLGVNYPNPFNSGTTIEFDIPESTFLTVSVYNRIGQKVKMLERGYFRSGFYQSHWDGCDETGLPVGAGTYFCRLQVGSESRIAIMTLVR